MAKTYSGPAVIQDTREQTPLDFGPDVPVKVQYLGPLNCLGEDADDPFGCFDYSLDGFVDDLRIERKSHGDLVGCCTGDNRKRFEAMLQRGQGLRFKALLIEADWETLLKPFRYIEKGTGQWKESQLHPHSVIGSLVSWAAEYDLHIITVPRRLAAPICLKYLTKFASRINNQRKLDRAGFF